MQTGSWVLAASLLVSLLGGLNQVFGFFSQINIATCVLSVVLAAVVVLVFPDLLRAELPASKTIAGLSPAVACLVVALGVIVVGVGPFAVQWAIAEQASWSGLAQFDRSELSAARAPLERARSTFERLGLHARATALAVPLAQIEAQRGNITRAKELLAAVESSDTIDRTLQARHDIASGIIAYRLGELVDAERHFQHARQNVVPDSHDEAVLLQNAAAVATELDPRAAAAARADYEHSLALYRTLRDRAGQAHILINLANLPEQPPAQARKQLEEAREIGRSLGNAEIVGLASFNLALQARTQGDYEGARALYHEATKSFERCADTQARS